MRFLEIAPADLLSWYVGGDREDRHAAPVRVEQPIDEMEVSGTATGGAHGELPGHGGLTRRRARCGLFGARGPPDDVAVAAERVGESIERITRQPVHPAHAGCLQGRHDVVGDRVYHD